MLKPPAKQLTGEAILSFGMYGSGKSEDWASIGEMYRQTETPGHFHILSTEYGRAFQVAEGFEDFASNSTIYETEDYDSLVDASRQAYEASKKEYLVHGERRDWIVVDSIGNALKWARDVWFEKSQGINYRDWQGTGGKVTDVGPSGWIQMDSLYKTWFNQNILRFPGHVYACAQADSVNLEGSWADPKVVRDMYGRAGMKPLGDKELGFSFSSVLMKANPSQGEYILTTVKDRKGREYLTREVIAPLPLGFTMTYLVNVAGWTL